MISSQDQSGVASDKLPNNFIGALQSTVLERRPLVAGLNPRPKTTKNRGRFLAVVNAEDFGIRSTSSTNMMEGPVSYALNARKRQEGFMFLSKSRIGGPSVQVSHSDCSAGDERSIMRLVA